MTKEQVVELLGNPIKERQLASPNYYSLIFDGEINVCIVREHNGVFQVYGNIVSIAGKTVLSGDPIASVAKILSVFRDSISNSEKVSTRYFQVTQRSWLRVTSFDGLKSCGDFGYPFDPPDEE